MNEPTTDAPPPITITRTFKLGDYKNLKVDVTPSELGDRTKWKMMVENVCDAYAQLFTHQMIVAELNGDIDTWSSKLNQLYEIKQRLLQEE